MPLIYITGVSGAGKSTVRNKLQERGYEAHDTDEDGFRGWYSLESKQMVDSSIRYEDAPKEWLKTYQLRIKRKPVEAIVPKSPDKIVFLCGTTPNDGDVWDLFDEVLYLIISEATLHQRIHDRTNNKFGKDPEEFEAIKGWQKDSLATAKRLDAAIIDAEQPIDQVIDSIIKAIQA